MEMNEIEYLISETERNETNSVLFCIIVLYHHRLKIYRFFSIINFFNFCLLSDFISVHFSHITEPKPSADILLYFILNNQTTSLFYLIIEIKKEMKTRHSDENKAPSGILQRRARPSEAVSPARASSSSGKASNMQKRDHNEYPVAVSVEGSMALLVFVSKINVLSCLAFIV